MDNLARKWQARRAAKQQYLDELDNYGRKLAEINEVPYDDWLADTVGGGSSRFTADEINRLKNTVIDEGQRLKDIGLTNNQLGPAIAGAYDKTTGKIYIAINDVDGNIPSGPMSRFSTN